MVWKFVWMDMMEKKLLMLQILQELVAWLEVVEYTLHMRNEEKGKERIDLEVVDEEKAKKQEERRK